MPRFHFHLRARGTIHHDPDGTDFPDITAACEHATAVARELMLHSDGGTRHWSICIENEQGQRELDLFFADIDPRLGAFSPQMRLLVAQTCRRLGALTDIMCAVRATRIEARILIARSRGKPQLAYSRET
jgi:hypothetical protein